MVLESENHDIIVFGNTYSMKTECQKQYKMKFNGHNGREETIQANISVWHYAKTDASNEKYKRKFYKTERLWDLCTCNEEQFSKYEDKAQCDSI